LKDTDVLRFARPQRSKPMKITAPVLIVSILAITLCAPAHAQQETAGADQYAPLPDKIANAKTVFLINETGKAKFGDALYKQISTWNRWQIVTNKEHADLILVLTDKGGMSSLNPNYYFNVNDPKTGEPLWTARTTMQGKLWRSWGSVAQSLLSDIQKRMK
jgi:hypothetical protein